MTLKYNYFLALYTQRISWNCNKDNCFPELVFPARVRRTG
jgi:hypothetical protein